MKKVVNGKLYDTQTANCYFLWREDHYEDSWTEETLCKKTNGEFFLARYYHGVENEFNEEVKADFAYIHPLKIGEAKIIAEIYLSGETYMELFGAVSE